MSEESAKLAVDTLRSMQQLSWKNKVILLSKLFEEKGIR